MKWFYTLLFLSPLAHASCTVTDALGHPLTLTKPVQRIVSLAPDITEDIYAAGAGGHLVGVIQGSDYPESAKKLPQVGSYAGLDLERIIALRPDLIVSWGDGFSRQLKALAAFNIPIYRTQPKRLEDIPRIIQQLGCLAGTQATADQAAAEFTKQVQTWRARNQDRKKVSVFFQLGGYSLITVNRDSWINQVIAICGGKNVFASAKWVAPVIGQEAVIAANPDVIFSSSAEPDWKKRWARWSEMAAVKQHRLYALHPDWIERAGPRLVLGIAEMCKSISPSS